MKVLVWFALVVVVAVAAGSARADIAIPTGFSENVRLEPAASFVAGKHASIYCADTMAHFNAADLALTGVVYGAGFSVPGGSQTFLSPWVCSYLNRWLAKKPVTRYHLAVSIEVLLHEAELEKGIADESLADCAALAITPQVVRRFFPLRRVYTIHGLMEDAWFAHGLQPPEYLVHCPAR